MRNLCSRSLARARTAGSSSNLTARAKAKNSYETRVRAGKIRVVVMVTDFTAATQYCLVSR